MRKLIAILIFICFTLSCSSTLEYYTTSPVIPTFLNDKEVVSVDTLYSYKGKSYIYNYLKKDK